MDGDKPMSQRRNDNMAVVPVMFFVGMAVGAFMTAMLTPKSGDEVRQTIRRRMRQAQDKASETKQSIQKQASEKMETARQATRRGRANEEQQDGQQ